MSNLKHSRKTLSWLINKQMLICPLLPKNLTTQSQIFKSGSDKSEKRMKKSKVKYILSSLKKSLGIKIDSSHLLITPQTNWLCHF